MEGKKSMNSCCHYAHYYLGSRFRFTWHNGDWAEGKLVIVSDYGFIMADEMFDENGALPDGIDFDDVRKDGDFRLILVHPSDMSSQQKEEYYQLSKKMRNEFGKTVLIDTPFSLDYLFKNGIDAFDLIENGSAIDKSTISIK